MQKVITINLNGNAYQIDEAGYAALVAYLEAADRRLAGNPDRAEIVADLEQAIADKCRGFLGPHKTVVTAAEVDRIIREMGPVDGADASGATDPTPGSTGPARTPRRLYRIREGAMWEGVCSGLAAYIGIHVVFVRIAFLGLIVWTAGLGLLVYWILASSIPEAETADQRAAAHGQPPFNAQELIDRARKNYTEFRDRRGWRRYWRHEHRAWRRGWPSSAATATGPYRRPLLSGLPAALLSVVFTLLVWFWAWTMFSMVGRGQIFGQPWPHDLPPWMGIVVLVVLFQFVAWPLRFARRRAYYAAGGGYYYGPLAGLGGVMSLAFWVLAAWFAYRHIPEVREIIRALPDVVRSFGI